MNLNIRLPQYLENVPERKAAAQRKAARPTPQGSREYLAVRRATRQNDLYENAWSELARIGACYEYPSWDGLVVLRNAAQEPVLYQAGYEVVVSSDVLEALKALPDKAGVQAVYDALEQYEQYEE
ncbi:hypothetical protein [Cohnella phaseoli]|uniref:Uncharacterized protein n=1 Tax=Cohnella phaseoli TaxID=456490 RepID=A0A3D9KJY9_9BACL|nr:hypothetical protein [Cohnella phaseoli]RED86196.1 hypothetical protein DFP98_10347 [Cohnella phaseoli]